MKIKKCINKKRIILYQILDILHKVIHFIWMLHMILVITLAALFAIGSLNVSLDDIQRGVELSTNSIIRLLNIFHIISYIILNTGFLTLSKMLIYTIRLIVVKYLNNDEMRKLGMPIRDSVIIPAVDWDSEENESGNDT